MSCAHETAATKCGDMRDKSRYVTLTWRRSLTLSMGAAAVLEMAAAIPPAKKSLAKEIAVSFIFRCYSDTVPLLFVGGACRWR